jgi:glucose/arabinose dehydrogenase
MRVCLGLLALWVSGTALAVTPGEKMDYGPVLASSLRAPAKVGEKRVVLAYKGLNIKLGEGASVCFDTELMRYAAGWTGGWLDLKKTHMTTSKGEVCPAIGGKVVFTTAMKPGVSHHRGLEDPRTNPLFPHRGPLPREYAHYSGLYIDGDRVVIAYTAGGGKVLEMPGAMRAGDGVVFTRTMRVEKTSEPLAFVLADGAPEVSAEVVNGPAGAKIEKHDQGMWLLLPPVNESAVFTVVMGTGDVAAAAKSLPAQRDPAELTHGGPARWKEIVETRGALAVSPAEPNAAYVVDTLTLPEENPWSSWMRVSGVDFFPDGKSAAVTTWNGDVWIVSGIDESLSQLAWKRYATGLYEPLGVKIVGGKVYALGRDQITRLEDLNGDGEADLYENFNNVGLTGDWYHLFKFDLDTDSAGNFYYSVVGAWAPTDLFVGLSTICKVSADGSKLEYIGRGFRAPNGMAVGPGGEIVIGDNQGHWMPASKINYIPAGKKDGFYGFPFDPRIEKTFDVKKFYPKGIPTSFDPPLCWIPYSLDTSSGGQAFVPAGEKWGPFGGQIVHTSYGKAALFLVMHEVKDGVAQGGVWKFPLAFESGIMRPRFNPGDGQLYVAGLRGWQSGGSKDGCLQRVRYTGKPAYAPVGLHVSEKGIALTFTDLLDAKVANDVGSFDVQQWQYKWSKAYGSLDYSVADPGKKGRDTVEVKSAKLQADGRTVFLEIADVKPVMQMGITYKLKGADGGRVEGEVYNTVNWVGKQ